ncbi:MAG: mechanosensitive ion channel family protein [Prochlorotrichaceae cyanobacterium]
MLNTLLDFFQLSDTFKAFVMEAFLRILILILFVILSFLLGRVTPVIIRWILLRFFSPAFSQAYDKFLDPFHRSLSIVATILGITFSLNIVRQYQSLYELLQFFTYLALTIATAWFLSRLVQKIIRTYILSLMRNLGQEANDLILVFETFANIIIGFFASVTFAQSQNLNLIALLAGLGIGGIALAFAAQETLSQLIGTIVIYLDRPYRPGEYIRVNFNINDEDVYARVESIGIRSTKLRVVAKNTLVIAPNSVMATKDIENISRGTKVMVLFYVDFQRQLLASEQELVKQIVQSATDQSFGIDPGSTLISIAPTDQHDGTRLRVSFFILGASEEALGLRKQTLEFMNQTIAKEFSHYDFDFVMQEPSLYVNSPVTR